MSGKRWPTALLLAAAFGCTDGDITPPSEADLPRSPAPGAAALDANAERAKLEQLARRFARALADDGVRLALKADLDASPVVEQKLHFTTYLEGRGRRALGRVARANKVSETQLMNEVRSAVPVEVYLPVPAHRANWTGDRNLLVATALDDSDAPVAFDLAGRRTVLDPQAPPTTPVLALVPVESDFGPTPLPRPVSQAAKCQGDCWVPNGGGGGGGGGGGNVQNANITISYAEFRDDFEGWLKGKPEFEIHVMGPATATDTSNIKSIQCVGEHAPAGHVWDMNALTWTGSATVFTANQMDAFEQANPGKAFLFFVLEDDDAACEIRTDENRSEAVLKALSQAYNDYKAAKDKEVFTPTGASRVLQAAKSGANFLSALHSFLNSNDDVIGFAVADSIAGRVHAKANWVVLDDKKNVNGWLNLVMQ